MRSGMELQSSRTRKIFDFLNTTDYLISTATKMERYEYGTQELIP